MEHRADALASAATHPTTLAAALGKVASLHDTHIRMRVDSALAVPPAPAPFMTMRVAVVGVSLAVLVFFVV